MFNFKSIKEKAAPGSWRRGYEYHQKKQVIEAVLEDNVIKGKVKGNFQDHYTTNLVINDDYTVNAQCDCPLEEEWCKHAVSVGLYAIENHLYDNYIFNKTGRELDLSDETSKEIKNPQGGYIFILNPRRVQKFCSVQIKDRSKNEIVKNIEAVLRSVIEIQKASNGTFELNNEQKVELAIMQELYKNARPDKKTGWFDVPISKFDKILKMLGGAEEVRDSKTDKRLSFKNETWKLILTVNVSLVGNVLLSLHWYRPGPKNESEIIEIYPFEEVRYFSRHLKWGQYKNIIIQTDTKISVLPPYLTKSTFTDIRDADGGKFVYEELGELKKLMTVEISETLEKLTLAKHAAINVLSMTLDEDNSIKGTLDFEYDEVKVPYGKLAAKTPYVTVKKPKEDIIYWIKRDLKQEDAAYKMLLACKFAPMQTNNLKIESDDAIDFYNFYMKQGGEDWRFEENSDFSQLQVAEEPLDITAKIEFGKSTDSFNVELYCSVGRKKFELEEIQEFVRQGKKYFYVEKKGNVEIPLTKFFIFEKTLQAFDALKDEKGIYSVKAFRAGLVAELIEQGITLKMGKKFEKFWNQITTFNTLEEVKLPKNLQAELRSYQLKGLNWLWFLYSYGLNGVLADDMGLGKTLQTLAMLLKAKEEHGTQPTLVICPTSVVFNWEDEIQKFAPSLKTLNLTGTARKEMFEHVENYDIIITSYALIRRDIDILKDYSFRSLILDESQNIKNYESITAQSVKQLNAAHKLALSGTPVENRLSELWSVFDFLMPGFLYDLNEFNYRYVTPIMDRADKSVESRLKKQISPFILRRMKRDVAKDLPDKVESIAYCKLTPDQKDLYLDVLDSTRAEITQIVSEKGMEKGKMSIFAALLRLRQVCCHPRLFDKEGKFGVNESGKFEHLKEMLEEIISEGGRILLFSQFVQMLDIIKEWFDKTGIKYEYLTGETKDRKERVDRFNNDESIPVFLISLKAGGTGLNLTGADYVIHYDPWWNPAVEDQATDRAYRIGQTKKVFVYRFIAKGTVEEKIQKLKERKRNLVDSIISVDRSVEKSFTFEDIKEILTPDL